MSLPRLPETHHQYADYWANNAQHYNTQGCYEWIADHLATFRPQKVLDIGCGTGEGLLALFKSFNCQIISLEENAACIASACETISAAGASVEGHIRFEYDLYSDQSHAIRGNEGKGIKTQSQITLVQADVLFDDPEVQSFLMEQGPFDAVTIWLIGSYMYRKDCRNLSALNIMNGGDYRLRVQNRVYELAAKVIRPNGILQVVDRGEAPSTGALMDDHVQAHRDQASVTDLEVFDVRFRTYTEPADRGVRMVASPGTSGRSPATDELSMISTLSRKPAV